MSKRLLAIACVVGFWAVGAGAQVEERTVIDSERVIRGGRAEPWMLDYNGLGMRFSLPNPVASDTTYFLLRPEAIKGPYLANLQHFTIEGRNTENTPTEELLAFERDEVRQGREPFFITATYEGRKRPVLLKWWLPGGICKEIYSYDKDVQAINIGDDRFVKFWVKNYARRRLSPHSLQNWCIQIDNSLYMQQKFYRVLDDDGNPQKAPWDEPFPQNDDEFADAAAYAFRRIKELAPDLLLIDNQVLSPLSDESRYGEVFGPLNGETFEGFLDYPFQTECSPDIFWGLIQRIRPPDGPIAYKLQYLPSKDSSTINELQQKFLFYIIVRGPNAFFGAMVQPGNMEPDLQWYASLKNALGSPVEPPQSALEPGRGPGYRLYWRRCQGGIAYLNLSGVAKTIYLPEDGVYYDAQGNPTTVLALGHQEAGYVTFEPGERVAKPRIDPRRPGLVTGPLTITLETEPFSSGTTIVYTLDGSEPDEGSTVYMGPFEIYESCVVKAKAFDAVHRFPWLPSFTNFATYRLTDQEPTVEFHHAYDNGSEFLEHDYPVVSLSHVSAHPVTITYYYYPPGGTASPWEDYELEPGTLTIRPGEQHRYFYVHIVNDAVAEPDETLMISITDPVNATLGENTIYTYTIEDNDRDPPVPPSPVPPVPPIPPIIVKEDFETGDFSKFDWKFYDDANWTVASEEKKYGIYSARAGSISDNESSTLKIRLDCISGDISFYCKVSSERDCDLLEFYIDGIRQDKWSGEKDWAEVSFPVTAGTRTFEWTYSKDGSESIDDDTAWIDDIVFPVDSGPEPSPPPTPPPPPVTDTLSEALDTALSFTTGGSADWFAQTTTTRYDGDAAQSGDISRNQESWMQTTVSGTGTVKFYWKVSSEEDFDFLEFYIDGSLQEKISGLVNWEQKTYRISTSGSHTLEWRYVKDGSGNEGSDCGWVDKVEW